MDVEKVVHVGQNGVADHESFPRRIPTRLRPTGGVLVEFRGGPDIVVPGVWVEGSNLQPSGTKFFRRSAVEAANVYTRLGSSEEIEAHYADEGGCQVAPGGEIISKPMRRPLP